jgi:hypothetical protein
MPPIPVEKLSTSDFPIPIADRHGGECGWKPPAVPTFGFGNRLSWKPGLPARNCGQLPPRLQGEVSYFSLIHAPAAARSVQNISPVTLLPAGPALHLPSGDLGVLDHGRLFYHQRWVAAAGVSSLFFGGPRSGRPLCSRKIIA